MMKHVELKSWTGGRIRIQSVKFLWPIRLRGFVMQGTAEAIYGMSLSLLK